MNTFADAVDRVALRAYLRMIHARDYDAVLSTSPATRTAAVPYVEVAHGTVRLRPAGRILAGIEARPDVAAQTLWLVEVVAIAGPPTWQLAYGTAEDIKPRDGAPRHLRRVPVPVEMAEAGLDVIRARLVAV